MMHNSRISVKIPEDKTEASLNNTLERLTRASESERKEGYTVWSYTINEMYANTNARIDGAWVKSIARYRRNLIMQNPEFRLKSQMDKTEASLNNTLERLTRASDSIRKEGYTVCSCTINEMQANILKSFDNSLHTLYRYRWQYGWKGLENHA